MSIREKLKTELVNHGLWPDEAQAVIDTLILLESSKPMQGRWDEDEKGYPSQLLAVLFLTAKMEAVKWIDNNKPQHFARKILAA